jgi:hypothetical protein
MPENPSPKRKVSKAATTNSPSACNDFTSHRVHQVSSYMLEGSLQSQQAEYGVLESLSLNSSNVSKMLLKAAVDCAKISIGMLQEMANTLVCAQKMRSQQANM